MEINEKRIGKTLQKIKPTTGSFKRAEKKKTDLLLDLPRNKREKTRLTKIRSEKGQYYQPHKK